MVDPHRPALPAGANHHRAVLCSTAVPPTCKWRRSVVLLAPLLFFLPLLFTVHKLHEKSAFEETTGTKSSKRPNHLVLGPAAGRGLPDRLQCQGLDALNNTLAYSSRQDPKHRPNVSFVTVFTLCNSSLPSHISTMDSSYKVKVGNVSYDKKEKSLAILHVFINFIKVSMPLSNIVILSDPTSEFSIRRNNVEILSIKGDYSREKLMLQRIRSYIAFLEQRLDEHLKSPKKENHYIFTDSDIAVVDDLGSIFEEYPRFHLALTFRNNKDQPINSGFIAVRGTADGILKAKTFLEEVLEVYISKYMKKSRMLGDQLALAWVIKSYKTFDARKFVKPKIFLEDMNGATVLFLPCALYNWTPPEGAGQFHGMPLDVKVVHYKGSRKRLMLESWNFFKSRSSFSDMLCLVLASGRTKYDF